jgi:CRP-like cAMP-binding protein
MFYYKFMWTSMGSLDDANPLPKLPAPLKAQMDIVLTRKIFVSIPVFHSCKPDELLQMVQCLVPYLALPGDVLIDEGSISLGLFFIMRGTVVVVRRLLDSRPDGATLASPNTRAPPTATPDAPAECPATMHRSVTLAKFGALSSAVSTAARAGVAALHVGQTGPTANEEVLHELSEGFFGEETVIYGRAASSTVRAVRHSDFFLLPMAVFDRVVEGNAEMRQKVSNSARLDLSSLDTRSRATHTHSPFAPLLPRRRVYQVMEYAEGRSEKSLARKVKMASAAIACRRAPRQRRVVSAAAMLSRARSADKEKGKAVRDAVVAMSQKLSAGASTNARDVTTTRRDRVHPGTPTDSQ